MDFSDRERLRVAYEEYSDYNINDIVTIKNESENTVPIGKVASFQDNTSGNGEQIYTITPNGTADNPRQVEEILF